MNVFEELQARGLIAQMTDAKRVEELLTKEKIKFYIGVKGKNMEEYFQNTFNISYKEYKEQNTLENMKKVGQDIIKDLEYRVNTASNHST